jgi:hypothetical protein
MSRNPSSCIKWFCPACEKESDTIDPNDRLAQQNAKLDTLFAIVATLQQQNQIILDLLRKEQSIEEKIKVQVTEALDSQKEKEVRQNNTVLFNVPECDEKGQGKASKHDQAEITKILSLVYPDLDQATIIEQNVSRLGRRREPSDSVPNPKPRPVKVVLDDSACRSNILRKAWRLKDSETYKKVGIAGDKTLEERKAEKVVRSEFHQRKQNGEDVVIFKGKVVA